MRCGESIPCWPPGILTLAAVLALSATYYPRRCKAGKSCALRELSQSDASKRGLQAEARPAFEFKAEKAMKRWFLIGQRRSVKGGNQALALLDIQQSLQSLPLHSRFAGACPQTPLWLERP